MADNTYERIAIRQLKKAGGIGIMVKDLAIDGSNLDRREVLIELERKGKAVFNRNADRFIWHEYAPQKRSLSQRSSGGSKTSNNREIEYPEPPDDWIA